jgi:hypothetical protein
VLDIEGGLVIKIEQSNTDNMFDLWFKIKLNDFAIDVLEWTETNVRYGWESQREKHDNK